MLEKNGIAIELKQILVVLMISASASFLTPISYQTNLMVMGPGGYSFIDFTKLGSGLCLVCMIAAVAITLPMAPFYADGADAIINGNGD